MIWQLILFEHGDGLPEGGGGNQRVRHLEDTGRDCLAEMLLVQFLLQAQSGRLWPSDEFKFQDSVNL